MGRKLFDYYDEHSIRGIKIVIGEFVSHHLINWYKENGELISVDEVNHLNRMKLAKNFYNRRTHNGTYSCLGEWYKKTREFEKYELLNDIAQFIDFKIPVHYWIRLQEFLNGEKPDGGGRTQKKAKYPGIDSILGMDFTYSENYILEGGKQNKNICVEPIETNTKTTNYNSLRKYLSDNDKLIDTDTFKAILFAMNIMSGQYITKAESLKRVKKAYPKVSKIKVSKILIAMDFVSLAKKESMIEFGRYSNLMNSIDYQCKKRIERER